MGRLLLGILAGIAMGFALGVALSSSNQPSLPAPMPTGSSVQAAAPDEPVQLDAEFEPQGEQRAHVAYDPEAKPRQVSKARLDAALERLETKPAERLTGAGQIWGRVTDPEGSGVGGVVLRASVYESSRVRSPDTVGEAPPEQSLDKAVREAAERYVKARASSFEVRTNSAGEFRFEGLPDREFWFQAFKENYVIEMSGRRRNNIAPGTEIAFVAKPVLELPIRVLLPDGTPAKEAVIACSVESGDRPVTTRYSWSTGDASLRVPVGLIELKALVGLHASSSRNEDAADMRSEPVEIEIVPGVDPEPLELLLASRIGIRGRITFASDTVGGTSPRVRLLPLAAGQDVDLEVLATAEPDTSVHASSEYSFLDLTPGRYAVGITRNWNGPVVVHRIVDVAQEIARCDIEVPPLDPTDYIVARVLGTDGRPIRGVHFGFMHEQDQGGSSSSSGMSGLRGEDGSYYISVPDSSRAAYYAESPSGKDTFTLRAVHEKHGSKSVELAPGQLEVEFLFSEPAHLEVTIPGYVGSTYMGRVKVTATPAGDTSSRHYYDRNQKAVDPDGVMRFEALEPGPYVVELSVTPKGEARYYSGSAIASLEIDLRVGANKAQLPLPTLHELDVLVPGAAEGTRVSLSRATDEEGSWQSVGTGSCGADSRVVFEDLPAGLYRMYAHGGDKPGNMEVEVPGGQVVFESGKK